MKISVAEKCIIRSSLINFLMDPEVFDQLFSMNAY
jgi:hypothetical protein